MIFKRLLLFFLFSFMFTTSFLFAQEKASSSKENFPSDSSSQEEKKAQKAAEKRKQILETFQWGLEKQISANLSFLIQEKDATYAEAVEKLYQENPNHSYNALIFEYFQVIEDPRMKEQAADVIRYYESEPDELMNRVLEYLVFLNKKNGLTSIEDVDEIVWALYENGSSLVSNKVLKTIGEISAVQFLPKLQSLYEDPYVESKFKPQILKTIGDLTAKEDLFYFTKLLGNDLPKNEKWACCEVLAKSGNDSIFSQLNREYRSGEPYLRLTILENVGSFNEANLLQLVQLGLKDDFWRIRKKAITICIEKKYSQLIPQLIFKIKTEPEAVVKQEAIKALGEIRSDEAFSFLKETLLAGKSNLSLQKAIARSLFHYPIDQYQTELLEWIKKEEQNENKLIPWIASLVGEMADIGYEPLIEYFLFHKNPANEHSAILAMIRLKKILQEDRVEWIRKRNVKNYLGNSVNELYKTVGKEIPQEESSKRKGGKKSKLE